MILQEINLYQDRFKPTIVLLSSVHMLILSGLAIVILLSFSYWLSDQRHQLELSNTVLLADKERLTQLLITERKKLDSLLANNQLDDQIAKISSDISVRKRIIDFVDSNRFGSGEGFSEKLASLAEISVTNVWLNEIQLSEQQMRLSGSALKAESVPEYFNLFRQRKLFSGQTFEIFEVERKKDQDWKLDFLIASRAGGSE
ncbi:MAG: PilN domain-containing protein [Gammaproteobacteria bacterium]|nr:PilN domain-containing protein [Gammaproteobacteria bacterium]